MSGLDLDPAMIERAQANADRHGARGQGGPLFLVGDVASLAFPESSFDLVVNMFSMHHWADPAAGLAEIGWGCPALTDRAGGSVRLLAG